MALRITVDLTDAEQVDVEATVGDARAWVAANVASLVRQCRDAQRARRFAAAGVSSLSDLAPDEVEAVLAPREVASARAASAAAAKPASAKPVDAPAPSTAVTALPTPAVTAGP